MRGLVIIVVLGVIGIILFGLYESRRDPYEIGMHMNYSIECENGFVIKVLGQGRGTIQVRNSDGTLLRCGQKIY